MKYPKSIVCLLLVLCCSRLYAQDLKKFEKASYITATDTLFYRVLFPEKFDPQLKYPVVFFLHSRNESGNDNEKQLNIGAKLLLTPEVRTQYPAIYVFPQCTEDSFWSNVKITAGTTSKHDYHFQTGGKPTKAMSGLLGMIDNLLAKPYVNLQQVYLGGASMGGMGTYELLRRKPKTFAAAFAICGADTIANVNKYKQVPLWIFHGGKDDIVSPAYSIAIANQLKIIGKEVKFSYYPDANHNSWDKAFAEPQFLSWLFSHRLPK